MALVVVVEELEWGRGVLRGGEERGFFWLSLHTGYPWALHLFPLNKIWMGWVGKDGGGGVGETYTCTKQNNNSGCRPQHILFLNLDRSHGRLQRDSFFSGERPIPKRKRVKNGRKIVP